MDDGIYQVTDERFVLIIGAGTLIFILSQLLRRTEAEVNGFLDNFRRASGNRKRSRIGEMEKDIKFLMEELSSLKHGVRVRDRLAEEHSRWDHEVIMTLIRLDPDIQIREPPPLIPPGNNDPLVKDDKNAST